jgi:Bacterial dnaA protein helix-turn-helix
MNQMVPIRAQEPVSVYDELVARHKARQARYAAVALPPAPKQKTPKQRYEDWMRAEELRWREQEERRLEIERIEIQARAETELKNELLEIRYPSVRHIIDVVATAYGVHPMEIVSQRRTRGSRKSIDIITPRQVVAYLARKTTILSLPQIGKTMNRDHTTLIYSNRRVEAMMKADPSFRAKVEELRAAVTGQVGQ